MHLRYITFLLSRAEESVLWDPFSSHLHRAALILEDSSLGRGKCDMGPSHN